MKKAIEKLGKWLNAKRLAIGAAIGVLLYVVYRVIKAILGPKDNYTSIKDFIREEKKALDRQLDKAKQENKDAREDALSGNPFRHTN